MNVELSWSGWPIIGVFLGPDGAAGVTGKPFFKMPVTCPSVNSVTPADGLQVKAILVHLWTVKGYNNHCL